MSGKLRFLQSISLVAIALIVTIPLFTLPAAGEDNLTDTISARLMSDQPFSSIETTAPTVKKPDWYFKAVLTYTISKKGNVTADMAEFAAQAGQTLNDSRGWSRLGVQFKQVESGGNFNLILSEASYLPSYSSGCSVDWSCRAGNNVVINQDRWLGASSAWNSGGGSLRDYRHMVVNHETGHWLGHDHAYCGGAGQSAPLMQQQSIELQGCKFNPWPLSSELWTNRL